MYDMRKDRVVQVRLTETQLEDLDQQRGPSSRSDWIRHLIQNAADQKTLQDAYPDEAPAAKKTVEQVRAEYPPPGNSKTGTKIAPRKKGTPHKFKVYRDAEKCEICGQRKAWSDPTCPG